jgi:hypothetical protein
MDAAPREAVAIPPGTTEQTLTARASKERLPDADYSEKHHANRGENTEHQTVQAIG